MNVLAIGTSNSSESINLKTIKNLNNVEILDLKTITVPFYSMQLERECGTPESILEFMSIIKNYPVILLAVPEYNGNIPAYFKNILDWCTRVEFKFLAGKKIILSTTTPGARGGQSVRSSLETSLPFFGAEVVGSYGISNYTEDFNWEVELRSLQEKVDSYGL